MMKLDPFLVDELYKIEWFKNCGKPINFTFPSKQLESWEGVNLACSDPRWIEVTEEAQGQLTEYLSSRCPQSYQGV